MNKYVEEEVKEGYERANEEGENEWERKERLGTGEEEEEAYMKKR